LAFRFPDEASLWFQRAILLSEAPWPSKTEFVLHGFDESRMDWVAKGRDYNVVAQAKGVIPRRVVIRYRYGGRRLQKAVMTRLGRSEFKHDFQRVLEPIEFYLVGGDRRTAPYTIDVVDRPRVKNLVLTGIPPAYTNKSTIVVEGGQEARLPAGSTLKIAGEATKSIVEAKVIFGEQEHLAELTGDRNFLLELEPKKSAPLEIILRDDRLEDDRPVRLHVRLVKDRPPRLKLRLSGIGDMVTPQAVIPMSVHISDDYGISSADLRWRLSSADAHSSIPLDGIEKGMRVTDPPIAYRWELSTHHPPPGEFLTFLVEALDLDDVAGPNLGSSETYTLKVVTIQEFSVEMIRRQEEQRRELKRLIEREEKDRDSLKTHRADPEDARTGQERALEGLERSQRLASRQTEGIADRMEQILAEMLNSRVAELRHARRIRSRVIRPLRDISTGPIQDLADHLGGLEAPSADTILKTAQSYDRIISQLNRILNYMDRIEKFTEVVAILRTIIESHSAATKETEEAYKKKIEDIFKEF
ncbi:MAG: hypothetical protein O6952_02965, partial [Planctomycetota bacterium]|nr:hypothetical protein [Planctomycetota bacterium]